MSCPQEPHRSFFWNGNPFRMIFPKGSYMSPSLFSLLNAFEETLAQRIRKLALCHKNNVLSFSWMKLAMELLCETHNDIKNLITDLELPVCDWDEKWIDVYLNNSVKLLDICIAFSSEISRLNQGHLLLQLALHNLNKTPLSQLTKGCSFLDEWKKHTSAENPRFGNCFSILKSLVQSLDSPKIKNSAKGKVLMRAMYGVKVITVFICGVVAAAFTGSPQKFCDLHVPGTLIWAVPFTDLQSNINTEIRSIFSSGRSIVLKELEAVDFGVNDVYPVIQQAINHIKADELQSLVMDLSNKSDKVSEGLDNLAIDVDSFFHIVLTGRDALLCNLRVSDSVFDPKVVGKVEQEADK